MAGTASLKWGTIHGCSVTKTTHVVIVVIVVVSSETASEIVEKLRLYIITSAILVPGQDSAKAAASEALLARIQTQDC